MSSSSSGAFGWPFFKLIGLIVLFMVALTAIVDLRLPRREITERCRILATGEAAARAMPDVRPVINAGGKARHTILAACPMLGAIKVNDVDAFRYGTVASGTDMDVTRLDYHVLPTRWQVMVHHPEKSDMPADKADAQKSVPIE